jgi:anti-anti-sigma factor
MLMHSTRMDRPRGFRISGEVDISNEQTFSSLLDPEVARGGDITLDLSGLGFMDSSGVRVLLRHAGRLVGRGTLRVTGIGASLRRTFDVMGIARAPGLVIVETAEDAEAPAFVPTGAVPVGRRTDHQGGSHPVAEARCACGCPYLYAADDLALFWEPGLRFSEGCMDRTCECHVAPLRG